MSWFPLSPPPPPPPPPPRPPAPGFPPPAPPPPARAPGAARRGAASDARADREEHAASGLTPPAGPVDAGGGTGSGGSGERGGDGGEGGRGNTPPGTGALAPRLRHVGDTIAMVCRYEQAQCVWSARIPLDPELLAGTVLYLSYSPALLALRFQTSDWEARDLLRTQLDALQALVTGLVAPDCGVVVSL